ncbi:hypothetical protein [Enterobacter hormaechei]
MANAHEPVVQAAKYRAGSNNEEVLDVYRPRVKE